MLNATKTELQFHMHRLGSRRRVARLYSVRFGTVFQALPVTDIDRFMSGQMISIGGILAKRCSRCGTARELESYWADDARASGLQKWCAICRMKGSGKR